MENNTQSHVGPAIAIVIIIGIVAVGGVLFYKNMTQQAAERTYQSDDELFEAYAQSGLSTSTDLESIEQDLNATEEVDISLLDELDENLLDFEELDEFNFDIDGTG